MDKKKISRVLVAAGIAAELLLTFLAGYVAPLGLKTFPDLCRSRAAAGLAVFLLWAVLSLAILVYCTICLRIGEGNSFCRENTTGLYRIFLLLLCASLLLLLFSLCIIRPVKVRLYLALASLLIALLSVLAWGLSKLVSHAVVLKEENDLTI